MFLIAGLGNPGSSYQNNRHNIGFMAIDSLAHEYGFSPERKRFQGYVRQGSLTRLKQGPLQVLTLKPGTYMNESGRSVGEVARFYKIPSHHIFVFHDELDLPFGKLRVKQGGGAAGHNGLKSVIQHIGADFIRVRMGIGHPGSKDRVTPYVLSDFSKQEKVYVDTWLHACSTALAFLVTGKGTKFQDQTHQNMNRIQMKLMTS